MFNEELFNNTLCNFPMADMHASCTHFLFVTHRSLEAQNDCFILYGKRSYMQVKHPHFKELCLPNFACVCVFIVHNRRPGWATVRRWSHQQTTGGLVCPQVTWTESGSATSTFWLCWEKAASERWELIYLTTKATARLSIKQPN